MLLSYNWLKKYVDLSDSLTPEELALKMTMSTVEVEGMKKQGESLKNIVVGRVEKVEKHPDADKLQVCTVSDGKERFSVVCGGSNVCEGMKVAFGKLGANVRWHGEGDLVKLTKIKIRGVESFGMICASSEIGLGDMFSSKDEKEILDLSHLKVDVGTPLAQALDLNDVVIDIDNKSMTHRSDLWGHYGMAREVATLYYKKLKEYNPVNIEKIKKGIGLDLSVQVEDSKLCPRYMAVAIDNIKIGPSPKWMQKRLLAVGLRPINNIVDITNYILYDLGQPLHAFDMEDVGNREKGVNIVVRRAKDGEDFITLDDKEHKLSNDDLVIATKEKAVALAGVMGGLNSEVQDNTTAIVFESANFDASNIRRTATRLGLRTDSSARFEKSLDPNNCELALRRAVELTLEICPEAKVFSKVVDVADFSLNQGPIELSLEFLYKKMGIQLNKKEVVRILESLGFKIKDKKDKLLVSVPTWRATKDILIPEDLIEEVARIYGYDNIAVSLPTFAVNPPKKNNLRLLERKIKNILSLEFNFNEVYNYSFISPKWIDIIGAEKGDFIELENPIAKDRPYLRRGLWTNLLENVEKNLHKFNEVKMFEIGQVFDKNNSGKRANENGDELLPRQDLMLGMVFAGKEVKKPFFELSEVLEGLFEHFNCEFKLKVKTEVKGSFIHPGRVAEIVVNNESIGRLCDVHPNVLEKIGVEDRVSLLELDLNKMLELVSEKNNYQKLNIYPAVERDIAFVVNNSVQHETVVNTLSQIDDLIQNIELFDVFQDEKIGDNKKSMAYHIVYRSNKKTLKAKEVDKIHVKLVDVLKKEFNAEVRK